MKDRKPIIICVTPKGRGVLFGWVDEDPTPGESVEIFDAIMVIRWRGDGIFRLASEGPREEDTLSPRVNRAVATTWTEFMDCSDAAIDAWGEI